MTLTSNIQKGGAFLEDSRALVEAWDLERPSEENLRRILDDNLLAKCSRARSEDITKRSLGPRLVDPGPQVIGALKRLTADPVAFREACYYEACRDDSLLREFAEGPLFRWYQAGRTTVTVEETSQWLSGVSADGRLPEWSESVRVKVARGLLAALRDFGVLEGATNKRFASPRLSPAGFVYVAYREHELGRSSRAIVDAAIWHCWLLDQARVLELLIEAERRGVLRYSQAGSSVRLDWRVSSLEEAVDAAA